MDDRTARDLLGLGERFSYRDLKSSFRRLAFICHPDTQGTDLEFARLNDAFELLKTVATSDKDVESCSTEDGAPLSDLGKGFPLTISARTCGTCDGNGYKKMFGERLAACAGCNGTGAQSIACNGCRGTGQEKNPKTGKNVGECRVCLGSGRFYPAAKRSGMRDPRLFFGGFVAEVRVVLKNGRVVYADACRRCDGRGQAWVNDQNKPFYVRCGECKGVGEIQIYNPVLPRGLFASAKSVSQ